MERLERIKHFRGKDSQNEFYPKRKSVKANWNTTCHTHKHQQGVKLKSQNS